MSTSLRVSDSTRARASSLAADAGASVGELVERALDAYERDLFWRQTRVALEAGPQRSEDDEAWERTVRDGLDRG